jgi:hypothetical protein
MNRYLSFAFALSLVACGYSEDQYQTDATAAACAKFEECGLLDFFGGTVDACITQSNDAAETDTTVCENYDSKAAKECVASLKAVTCDDLAAGATLAGCDTVCSTSGTDTDM